MLLRILTTLTIFGSNLFSGPLATAYEYEPSTGKRDRSIEIQNLRDRIISLDTDIDLVTQELDQAGFVMVAYQNGNRFALQHLGFEERDSFYYLTSVTVKGSERIKTLNSLQSDDAVRGFLNDLNLKLQNSTLIFNDLKLYKKKLEGQLKFANEQFDSLTR
jgi:hypothetical protein